MTEGRALFAGEGLRAEIYNADRDVLFVTFDHWERGKAGFSERLPSQTVAAAGFAELAIRTARNDWYLNGDLAPLEPVLAEATEGYGSVRCFAFSMGGYAALRLSRALNLDRAVLISPQWSIFPEEAPFDRRYRREATGLERGLGDLAGRIGPGLRGVMLFDPVTQAIDGMQAGLIAAEAPGLARVAMAFGGHPASSHLTDGGQYGALRRLAYSGVTDPAAYRELHVRARVASRVYGERRKLWLARRSGKDEIGGGDQ